MIVATRAFLLHYSVHCYINVVSAGLLRLYRQCGDEGGDSISGV